MLSAGLPYPASSPLAKSDAFVNHPSNTFTLAFEVAQFFSMRRGGYGSGWPLAEFWKDKVKPHRKIIDQFIEPILVEALTKRVAVMNGVSTDRRKLDTDVETLLSQKPKSLISKNRLVESSSLCFKLCVLMVFKASE
jgi:hypothetical protein